MNLKEVYEIFYPGKCKENPSVWNVPPKYRSKKDFFVSDTTPLISLLKIKRVDLLKELFGEVLIPQAVFDELTSDKRFQVEADQICQKEFIFVKRVNVPESVNILKRATGLDQGESEAIVLTDELKADILLMDEARGRNVSAQMGLSIMETIGK